MGRIRTRVPRSRLPLHRRLVADPSVLRRYLVVVVLAALTAMLVQRLLAEAERVRHQWGDTRYVMVVSKAIEAGEPLAPATASVRWPVALLPSDPVEDLADGAVAVASLDRGTPLTASLVTSGSATGLDDRQRIAVPIGRAPIPVSKADRVDVWATVDPSLAGGELSTRRVAADAVVVSAGPDAVVVAVEAPEVDDVAEAAALATITLVAKG